MQKTLIILTVVFMIAVMVYAGINRYSLVAAGEGGWVFKLDRWTGEMWLCGRKCEKVEFPE